MHPEDRLPTFSDNRDWIGIGEVGGELTFHPEYVDYDQLKALFGVSTAKFGGATHRALAALDAIEEKLAKKPLTAIQRRDLAEDLVMIAKDLI